MRRFGVLFVAWSVLTTLALGVAPGGDLVAGQVPEIPVEPVEPDHAELKPTCANSGATIRGTAGDDLLVGTPGDDVIVGLGGNDEIDGRGGNDVILGGDGDDTILGGAGNDLICGGPGNDDIDGRAGADRINGQAGDDVIRGGADDDVLFGGRGLDVISGSTGNDTISGGAEDDDLEGDGGDDVVFGDAGADVLRGRGGADELWGGGGQDELRGGTGDDQLHGGAGRDRLFGNEDNDTLFGDGGNDRLRGGPGDDDLVGGGGDTDRSSGGDGDDTCDSEVADATCETSTAEPPADLVAPYGLFATSDGSSSVELTWLDPFDAAGLTGVDIIRDGTVIGAVAPGAETFTDTTPTGGVYELRASYDTGTAASDPMTVAVGVEGWCWAVKLDDTTTALLWDSPPSVDSLWVDEAGTPTYLPLSPLFQEGGSALALDTERHWGAADPDYRITASNYDGALASENCLAQPLSDTVIERLAEAGLPILPDGDLGFDASDAGAPTQLSFGAAPERMSSDIANAPDLCDAGGAIVMELPKGQDHKLYATLYVPAGVTVTFDAVSHKGNTSSGDWVGQARAYILSDDGSRGPQVSYVQWKSPYYWSEAGDIVHFDDRTVISNGDTEGHTYLIEMRHVINVSINDRDLNPHYRIEDFTYTNSEGEELANPCGSQRALDCQALGGNLLVEEPFWHDGEIIGRGCYDYDGCVGSAGVAIDWLIELSCRNDALLDQMLLVGGVIVIGGVLIATGNPFAIGAAFGLATAMWTCDTSDNGFFTPAGSIGDIDPGCVAVETAMSAASGGLGAWIPRGNTLISAFAVSCTTGALEGGTTTALIGWVGSDQVDEVNLAEVNAALGCVTSGVIGAAGSGNRLAPVTEALSCSFGADTPVVLGDGSQRPISQIAVGDHVLALDPQSGRLESRPVEGVFEHEDTLIDLEVGIATVATTTDHPFWNETDGEFQRVDEFDVGDLVLGAGGESMSVGGLVSGSERSAVAYNLAVSEIHTYFVVVGGSEALVHNTCLPALRDWTTTRFQFGGSLFHLDRSGMSHILERHHPIYWNGTTTPVQTFFDESMTIADVEHVVREVLRQNRDELMGIGSGSGQVSAVVDGVSYVVGVTRGRVGQCYPEP